MIKVPIELHPYGEEKNKSEINALYIANAGGHIESDGLSVCTYHYWMGRDPRVKWSKPDGEIEMIREEGVFSLVQKCLEDYTSIKVIDEKGYFEGFEREKALLFGRRVLF
jgi:hypothetical protein